MAGFAPALFPACGQLYQQSTVKGVLGGDQRFSQYVRRLGIGHLAQRDRDRSKRDFDRAHGMTPKRTPPRLPLTVVLLGLERNG